LNGMFIGLDLFEDGCMFGMGGYLALLQMVAAQICSRQTIAIRGQVPSR